LEKIGSNPELPLDKWKGKILSFFTSPFLKCLYKICRKTLPFIIYKEKNLYFLTG
jgi:hypothetical protein